jgi:RNA polymerase sigma factor (sigma-70 family)
MRTDTRSPDEPAAVPTAPERPSFEAVFKEHVDRVYWLLRRLGVAEAQCDDATQEVFLIVLRRLPEYQPQDRLVGWLAAIAARIAAKFRARAGRDGGEKTAADAQLEGPDEAFELEAEIASAEEVRRVLDELAPDLCLVFMLHHFDGLPAEEIAHHLDVPVGTVKSRVRRATRAARAAWTRYKARERHEDRSKIVPIFGPVTWLEAGREIPRLPDDVRGRIWAGIQRARVGGGDGGGGGPSGGDGGQPAAPTLAALRPVAAALGGAMVPAQTLAGMVVAGLFGVGLVAGVALGALWAPFERSQTASALLTSSPEAGTMAARPPASTAPASTAPASAAPAVPVSAAPSVVLLASAIGSANASAAASLAVERGLMDRAHAALQAESPGAALDAVYEHAAAFRGGGRLAEERETLWIAALLRAGRADEARERFAHFATSFPNSPRLAELREAVAAAVPPRAP